MIVEQIDVGNRLKNFTYVISQGPDAWVIDPYDALQVVDYLDTNNLRLKMVINTHDHFDHVKGNDQLVKTTNCELYDYLNPADIHIDSGLVLKPMLTPGHTMDHVAYRLQRNGEDKAFFSGDLLFHLSVGNCKNGGEVGVLFDSIEKVKSEISPKAIFYPGHNYLNANHLFTESIYEQTLELSEHVRFEDELKYSIFLNTHDLEIREKISSLKKINFKSSKEFFIYLRSQRDIF